LLYMIHHPIFCGNTTLNFPLNESDGNGLTSSLPSETNFSLSYRKTHLLLWVTTAKHVREISKSYIFGDLWTSGSKISSQTNRPPEATACTPVNRRQVHFRSEPVQWRLAAMRVSLSPMNNICPSACPGGRTPERIIYRNICPYICSSTRLLIHAHWAARPDEWMYGLGLKFSTHHKSRARYNQNFWHKTRKNPNPTIKL